MKKINLDNMLNNENVLMTSEEKIRDINGGCTLVLGCNSNGYYTIRYNYECKKKASHTKAALEYAAANPYGPGVYQVTGSKDVLFLG